MASNNFTQGAVDKHPYYMVFNTMTQEQEGFDLSG